jgi:LmbE family N-acetylglucosaminyl deacetylase
VLNDADVARVLAITAHPDDIDFGAAGTIARWTDAGIEVTYCVVTDGAAGGFDEDVPRAEMPALRQAEQVAAAKHVGVQDVRFLGYPDGVLEPTLGLRRDLARVIRQVRPDRVLCPSPERNYVRIGVSHPDHRAVGSATLDAVYPDARNPFAFPELRDREALAPWKVREVWLLGSPAPTQFVDVTATFPRKIAALSAHASQIQNLDELEQRIRGFLARAASLGGLPEGHLAESFQVLETALDPATGILDLREELPSDREPVRDIHLRAFGDHGLVVAGLVDALRETITPTDGLSLVAEHDGQIVGHVMFTRSLLDLLGGWLRCKYSAPWPSGPSTISAVSARPTCDMG